MNWFHLAYHAVLAGDLLNWFDIKASSLINSWVLVSDIGSLLYHAKL